MQKELAIRKLLDGNSRFAANKCIHPNIDFERRFGTLESQSPFALVITCFDSRVPPEIIFDQGIGDLLVLRIPGPVLNEDIIGSVEYAVTGLNISLILVMGHENCAAVKLALNNTKTLIGVDKITKALRENIGITTTDINYTMDEASIKNVKTVCSQLNGESEMVSSAIKQKKLEIIGLYYHLETGITEIISDNNWSKPCAKTIS